MTAPIQIIHHEVHGQHYFLGYYDTDIGKMNALVALDSWRTHYGTNFAKQDMEAMANMIDNVPVSSRFNLPLV